VVLQGVGDNTVEPTVQWTVLVVGGGWTGLLYPAKPVVTSQASNHVYI
jgi:hypothetical protein